MSKEMKKAIKLKCIEKWEMLQMDKCEYGLENIVTIKSRSEWIALDDLYWELFHETIDY